MSARGDPSTEGDLARARARPPRPSIGASGERQKRKTALLCDRAVLHNHLLADVPLRNMLGTDLFAVPKKAARFQRGGDLRQYYLIIIPPTSQ